MVDRIEASSSQITVFNTLNMACLTQNRDTRACGSVFDQLGQQKCSLTMALKTQ